jgi:putative transposase
VEKTPARSKDEGCPEQYGNPFNMGRLPRFSAPGQPQHVIHRGNNRRQLFASADDFIAFGRYLQLALKRTECQLHAYVLMTNHVHLLISQPQPGAIGKMMQSVGGRYARYFNDRFGRTGTLWEGRYRATVINSDDYLFTCCRYIEENPVRAGMVPDPAAYRWSSFAANALGAEDALVTPHERYVALGPSARAQRLAYRALFRDSLERSAVAAIRDATNHAWALGDERFQRTLGIARRAARLRPPRCPIRCQTP